MEPLAKPRKVRLPQGLADIVEQDSQDHSRKVEAHLREILIEHYNYKPNSNGK